MPTVSIELSATGGVQLDQLPAVSRKWLHLDACTGGCYTGSGGEDIVGDYLLVQELNATDTVAGIAQQERPAVNCRSRSRPDASLVIDPGTVVKIDGSRIEARFGGNLIAEGIPGVPVIFTSLEDQRYGGGGTFNTNDRPEEATLTPVTGVNLRWPDCVMSIDQAVIAGAVERPGSRWFAFSMPLRRR